MQKILKLLAIVTICTSASNAYSIENVYRPYIGINYAYSTANAKGYHSRYNAPSLTFGSVYNKYFGTELFYQASDKQKYDSHGLKSSYYQAYGLDMLAYLPLFTDKFNLVATAGIGEYILKNNYIAGGGNRDSGIGYRFGGGLSFNVNEAVSFRFITRHIELDKISKHDHMLEYSFGMRYVFNY